MPGCSSGCTAAAGVRTRHLALPLEAYPALDGFTGANDAFIEVAVELGEQAVDEALDAWPASTPSDVDLVVSTTVTGVAAPEPGGAARRRARAARRT